MAMEITNNYSSYAVQGMAESSAANSTKKKETVKTSEKAGNSKSKSTTDYMSELAKLAPSVECSVRNGFSSAKTGKTLTINPKLLEKMQNDPEKEKEVKELIKGVESMTKLVDSINNASGWKTVFRHSYIDENGKYREVALTRNEHGYKISEKFREERRKNAEKLIEKTKEKAAKKKEELKEMLEEKKVEQLLSEKMAASEDGMIYLDDTEFKTIMEAMKEDSTGKANTKEQAQVGANLDLQV
ncbi:MAG: hypothetical protein K2N24_04405 [Lachnospiraceae bacterium]|nr:hypothetical protein [Lachnospiraceae bacterium]